MLSLLFGWTLLSACNPVSLESYDLCDLQIVAEPGNADPGDEITLVGGPLSADFDVYVSFGGVPGEVQSIQRDECGQCDECKLANDCLACGECLECDALCTTCVESTTVVVPDLPDGPVSVSMINNFGSGETDFRIGPLPPPQPTGDTGTPQSTGDTGSAPTPTADTAVAPNTAHTGGVIPPTADTGSTGDTADTAGSTADTADDTAGGTSHTGGSQAPTGQTGHTGTP